MMQRARAPRRRRRARARRRRAASASRERGDAHVGGDASLDREQQRRAAAARARARATSLVSMPWRNVDAVGPVTRAPASGSRDRRPPPRRVSARVLRRRVAEVPRQRDAAVVGVHRAARRQVRMQAVSIIAPPPCAAPAPLDKGGTRARQPRMATYEDILYETARRHRLDHHQPARGAERVPRADRRRADRTPSAPRGTTPTSASSCSPAPASAPSRPAATRASARDAGYGGARRHRPRHARAARRHPRHPEAGHRDGERLRDRRRPRAARALRPLDRRRHRASSARSARRSARSIPGFGTAYLARLVGEKKAREIWYLCRQYTRSRGARDGTRQRGRPGRRAARRDRDAGAASCSRRARPRSSSPSSRSTPTPSTSRGITELGFAALELYYATPEAEEGRRAFLERRPPHFRRPR